MFAKDRPSKHEFLTEICEPHNDWLHFDFLVYYPTKHFLFLTEICEPPNFWLHFDFFLEDFKLLLRPNYKCMFCNFYILINTSVRTLVLLMK